MKRFIVFVLAAFLAVTVHAQSFSVRPGWDPDSGNLPAIGVGYWESWTASEVMGTLQGLSFTGAFRGLQLNIGFGSDFKPDHILAGITFTGILDFGSTKVSFPFGPLFGVCRMATDGGLDYGGTFGVVWAERYRPGVIFTATRGTWGVGVVFTF